MEKAYDVKDLLARLKAKGVDVAEDAAAVVLETVLDWAGESAVKSPTPFDDILAVALPHLKTAALAQIDKIDGEDDEGR